MGAVGVHPKDVNLGVVKRGVGGKQGIGVDGPMDGKKILESGCVPRPFVGTLGPVGVFDAPFVPRVFGGMVEPRVIRSTATEGRCWTAVSGRSVL